MKASRYDIAVCSLSAIGVAAGISAVSYCFKTEVYDPAAAQKQIRSRLCPMPDQAAIDAMAGLLETPQPIDEQFAGIKPGSVLFEQRMAAQEAKFGVTFAMQPPVEKDPNGADKLDNVAQWNVTSNILAQAGVRLNTSLEDITDEQPSTKQTLGSDEIAWQNFKLARDFSRIPLELTKKTDLTSINYVHTNNFAGLTVFQKHAILLTDTVDTMDDHAIKHEFYHMIDAAECGTPFVSNDPGYAALNTKGASVYTDKWADLTNDPVEGSKHSLESAEQTVTGTADPWTCPEKLGHALDGIEMTTPYSYKDAGEDKAELGAGTLTPESYSLYLNTASPVIRKKFLVEMTRLSALDKGTAQYFALQYRLSKHNSNC